MATGNQPLQHDAALQGLLAEREWQTLVCTELTLARVVAIEHADYPLRFLRFPPLRRGAPKDASMANTQSAKKAARQTVRRTSANKAGRSRMRSSVRRVEEAIASGNKEAAQAALKEAEPVMARTAQKGILHRKTASRKVSRLAKRIGAIGSA
jgi:small subunit ribosomal protein S20